MTEPQLPLGDSGAGPTVRCTMCASEFTADQIAQANECPTCGDGGVPCAISDDVQVTINWHELRILGIWAEQWAASHKAKHPGMQRTVAAIAGRLWAQHPERSPLTMSGEIAGVAQAFGPVEVRGFDVDEEANDDV